MGLPEGFRIRLDPALRRVGAPSILIGGSPTKIMRLGRGGAQLVDRLSAGAPVPADAASQALVIRLLRSGMAHPHPVPEAPGRAAVSVVIPVRNDAVGLETTLAHIASATVYPGETIVVDDGSEPAEREAVRTVAGRHGARLVCRDATGGPAAARNDGWRAAHHPIIAFVDANCAPQAAWLAVLLPHFADPEVGAVAPRITVLPGQQAPPRLVRYERTRSSLDLGPVAARVAPGTRVAFVPSATVLVRRSALEGLDGFDERLRVGEDVDLVWRLVAAGAEVRYEPQAQVGHPTRSSWGGWMRQRCTYGASAAGLAARHGHAVTPLRISAWSASVWILAASGQGGAAVALAAASAGLLATRLRSLPHPLVEATRLAGLGHLHAGRAVAAALRGPWWPVLAAAALSGRRGRRILGSALIPLALEWLECRPTLDPCRWVALRLADDLSYGTGVWVACARERRWAGVAPAVTDWPVRPAGVVSRCVRLRRWPGRARAPR